MAAGAAFRQGWPQAGADYRGANIYPCLRCDNVHNVYDAIIAVMGFISFVGLLLAMPETVKRGAVPFSAKSVLRDFRNVFCNRLFLFGAATISLSYIPMMSWVAVSPVILIDAGGLTTSQFAWTQVPVFGAVIVANAIVARFVKDPTEPRFIMLSGLV
ncbi:hypothetical protein BED12_24895 [Escherichia coli]|nr:hypothetical protein [Escherichia coli]